MRAATAGGRGRGTRWALLCTMDWVEEAPERELPERDEDSELGFTSLALGASASSLGQRQETGSGCTSAALHKNRANGTSTQLNTLGYVTFIPNG